jgi:hypothetical protein
MYLSSFCHSQTLGSLVKSKCWILVSVLLLGFVSACANEQSKEELDREKLERKVERLASAEGNYSGEVATINGSKIPFALVVNVLRNPNDGSDEPTLSAKMRLGLFGGIDLNAQSVSYDYGSQKLTATYGGGSAAPAAAALLAMADQGKSLELQAVVTKGSLQDASLLAASGQSYVITDALRSETLQLADAAVESVYAIEIDPKDGGNNVNAIISLTRRSDDTAAPISSDLPRLPKIDGTLRFLETSLVAHLASRIEYDALADSLDIYFPGGSGMRLAFNNLSLRQDSEPLHFDSKPNLSGTAEMASQTIGTIKTSANQLSLIERSEESKIPAANYLGYYQNTSGRKLPAVANVTYLGSEGSSGTGTPFPRFPSLSLQFSVCMNGQAFSTKKMSLLTLDYLNSEATFVDEEGQNPDRFFATYGKGWQTFDAEVIDAADGGGANSQRAKVHFEAAEESSERLTCADAPKSLAASASAELLTLMSPSESHLNGQLAEDGLGDEDSLLTYEGYLTRGNSVAVPVSVSIFPRQNPGSGSDEPSLQVTSRIGFFGGANIASEPAVFSWGSGRITAAFTRTTGAPLEFRAILETDSLRDAVLIGPNLGENKLVVKEGVEPYVSPDLETMFNTLIANGDGPITDESALRSVLNLRSRSEGGQAPANIDLPVLPSIDASLRIDGLAQTPQNGSRIVYDALRGTLEIGFSESSTLKFEKIFLQPTGNPVRPYKGFTELSGQVILGGQAVAVAKGTSVSAAQSWSVQDLPHTIYAGTYQVGENGRKLKALARIDYPGNAGQNTGEYPFITFPNLHLTVSLCWGTRQMSKRNLELEAVDYLNRGLVFKNRSGDGRNALEIEFEPRWNRMVGEFRDSDGGSGQTESAVLDLKALLGANNIDCSVAIEQ